MRTCWRCELTTRNHNQAVIEEFRSNQGKVGGRFEGAPVLLLTTTGRKSGVKRINPMMYQQEGDTLYVFASKGGAPTNPDWYHNLVANTKVRVEVGTEAFEATATVLHRAERDRVFEEQVRRYPFFADYQAKTERIIPVVALRRV